MTKNASEGTKCLNSKTFTMGKSDRCLTYSSLIMSNERFHNENEKKRIAWHGGRYIPGFNSMQGKILYRNQPRRIDIIGKYGNVAHEKLRRTGGCERQRIFLSIDSRIFLSIDSRIFLLMDSRIFLSIDSRILCLEPLENELSLLVKGEAVRLENV